MKFIKLLIVLAAFFTACEHKPEPNVYLVSSYDLLKKGDLDTAKLLVEKAERKSEADDALYYLVRGAVAAITMDFSFRDTVGIEKSIEFFEGDNEKLAWAHFVKGFQFYYRKIMRDEAAVEYRMAENYADKTDCKEVKFHIYLKLLISNINAYNFDNYEDFTEKMRQNAVTDYDTAEYWSCKSYGYDLGLIDIDSAKLYAKKSVEYIEKTPKFHSNIFIYLDYAELIYNEDDISAEKFVKKAFEIDSLLPQAQSLWGKINLKRGDETKAKLYFEKSKEQGYWVENEDTLNRLLAKFYADKNDYKQAYEHALLMAAAKDSLIVSFQEDNVKPVQIKFADEIENLKLKSAFEKKIFLTISVSAVIFAVLVLTVVFQKLKLSERSRKIFEAQQTINGYNQKIKDLQNTSQDKDDSEIKFLQQKVQALEQKFSDVYVRGKELYSQILSDKKIGRWSKEDYKNFIDYYQSVDFLFVYGFETDYVSLTDRQKIFLILLHIGKTKEQVMQIMTIEDVTFRSMKSRCEGQKR